MTIAPATPADLPAVHALLTSCGLPVAGLAEHVRTALVARAGARIVGSAALEVYGRHALLRSVAVDPAHRSTGLGQRLTAEALALARAEGLSSVTLLTETAAGFFPKFGFVAVSRADVPAEVQASAEFAGACPASAQAMRLDLA
ncbi:MAG: arsenic resistance N-acetyltransferase ArsN2 [Acidobacteriota bacterium]